VGQAFINAVLTELFWFPPPVNIPGKEDEEPEPEPPEPFEWHDDQ